MLGGKGPDQQAEERGREGLLQGHQSGTRIARELDEVDKVTDALFHLPLCQLVIAADHLAHQKLLLDLGVPQVSYRAL